MAIVKMKKVRILAVEAEKDSFLDQLLKLGCVEISDSKAEPEDPILAGFSQSDTLYDVYAEKHKLLDKALGILNKYAPGKTGLFSELNPVDHDKFFSGKYLDDTLAVAEDICENQQRLDSVYASISTLKTKLQMLVPWARLDIPLEMRKTKNTNIYLFTLSSMADESAMLGEINELSELVHLEKLGEDKEQKYYCGIIHRSVYEDVVDILRRYGCTEADFEGMIGTVSDNIASLNSELTALEQEKNSVISNFSSFAKSREDLQTCVDRAYQEMRREEAKESLLKAGSVICLEGWAPEASVPELTKLLENNCCAYEFSDPEDGDDVPVKLKNSKLIEPLNMVTEMYSLPAYNNIDPNPLIFPWFTVFFGIMYADMGYGLILLALGIIGSKLVKKKGTIKYMTGLLIMGGVTTMFFGFLFGSFFGDSIPVICDMLGLEHKELWSLINPLEEPMTALVASLAIGVVHLLVGMAIKVYLLIRDGKPLDALFDVGSWWVLFAGIGLGALGKGWVVAIIGAAMLVLTQGRHKPTLIGKLISGLASLYDITSYISDVLSYSRLLALMLAGGVIASVVNVLGSMTGSIVVFAVVFVVGHLFNMAINIIGTYVHAARLQYLEFFGKFYEDGGRPFSPFAYKTKYTDIIKEEK